MSSAVFRHLDVTAGYRDDLLASARTLAHQFRATPMQALVEARASVEGFYPVSADGLIKA